MFLCDVLAFGPASPPIYQRPRSLTVLLFMCYSNVSDTLMALNLSRRARHGTAKTPSAFKTYLV